MKQILFIYEMEKEQEALWRDGLWAALQLLEKEYQIEYWNIAYPAKDANLSDIDFVLGWGAFGSRVAKVLTTIPRKKGLILGGYSAFQGQQYDILFYEVPEWSKQWLKSQNYTGKIKHAFGVNKNLYYGNDANLDLEIKIWDYITVGAFALWKRQHLLADKPGYKIAVGQIQKNNLNESVGIIGGLVLSNVVISDSLPPEKLGLLYNLSKTAYIPADTMGGGERSVLEARACQIDVEVESDNPKLKELLTTPVWDEHYYAKQIKEGIEECL